jgi:hypothetical protein
MLKLTSCADGWAAEARLLHATFEDNEICMTMHVVKIWRLDAILQHFSGACTSSVRSLRREQNTHCLLARHKGDWLCMWQMHSLALCSAIVWGGKSSWCCAEALVCLKQWRSRCNVCECGTADWNAECGQQLYWAILTFIFSLAWFDDVHTYLPCGCCTQEGRSYISWYGIHRKNAQLFPTISMSDLTSFWYTRLIERPGYHTLHQTCASDEVFLEADTYYHISRAQVCQTCCRVWIFSLNKKIQVVPKGSQSWCPVTSKLTMFHRTSVG